MVIRLLMEPSAETDAWKESAVPGLAGNLYCQARRGQSVRNRSLFSAPRILERVFDILKLDWKKHVEIDKRFFRPAEVDRLIGDSSKARRLLGWRPRITFDALVTMMVDADLELAQCELHATGL